MDSTYRTNRYDMLLLHIVGAANTNTSSTIALCFLRSESEANYQWALSELLTKLGSEYSPRVIATDRELTLMNAVAVSFLHSKHLLCSWYITKNVAAKQKTAFPKETLTDASGVVDVRLTWDQFSKRWTRLITDPITETEFNQQWQALAKVIPNEVSEYIENSWMIPWKDRFCVGLIGDVMYFRALTTSRVEGRHAALKKLLPNSNLSLLQVYKAIQLHVERQFDNCVLERARQLHKRLIFAYKADTLDNVQTVVSHQALKIAYQQLRKATDELSSSACSKSLSRSFRIPCSHAFARLLASGTRERPARLTRENFNVFWLLNADAVTSAVAAPRSPTTSAATTTGVSGSKRTLSKLELADKANNQQQGLRRCGYCKLYERHNRTSCPIRKADKSHEHE